METITLSIDVEPDLHTGKYKSLEALKNFIAFLKKYNIKVTFFVTCDCIKKNSEIFREIKKQGHEIALHGYTHERIDKLSFRKKVSSINKSLSYFKRCLGLIPQGFRAPQHGIDNETLKILNEKSFKYDSSIIPWNFYHLIFFWKIKVNFFHHFAKMKKHKRKGITEIPISSFILPFSSITLRMLPLSILKIYFFFISFLKNPIFLMHSWDLIEVPNSKIYRYCPKEKFKEKLEYMINFFSKRYKFSTILELTNPI
jgi:hypothetical protein